MVALENYVMWCLIKDEYIKTNNVAPCPYLFPNVPHQSFIRTASFLRQSAMCRWINCLAFRRLSLCPTSWLICGAKELEFIVKDRYDIVLCSILRANIYSCNNLLQVQWSKVPVQNIKVYRGVKVSLRSFLTSALDGGEWPTSRPSRFTPGKQPRYPLNTRLWMRPQSRSGRLGEQKTLVYARNRTQDHPGRGLVSLPH